MNASDQRKSTGRWWDPSEWGLSVHERRAVGVLVVLLLIGSAVKVARHHQLTERLTLSSDHRNLPQTTPSAPPPYTTPSEAHPLNINRATALELEMLPGIGPVRARAIVEHRRRYGRFRAKGDIVAVKGIGPKTLARIEPLISTADPLPGIDQKARQR